MDNHPVINYQGIGYYEQQLTSLSTEQQFRIAARLASAYSLCPYSKFDLQEFVRDDIFGIPQAWLLWNWEKPLRYAHQSDSTLSAPLPGRLERRHPGWPSQSLPRQGNWLSQSYQALLLLYAFQDPPDGPESLVVAVEALCSDPWANPVPVAQWANLRLEGFWEALRGDGLTPYELRFPANEAELTLQQELKSMGYFCYDYDPDPSNFGPQKQEDGFGQLYFAKLKRIRDRRYLPNYPSIGSSRKRRKKSQ